MCFSFGFPRSFTPRPRFKNIERRIIHQLRFLVSKQKLNLTPIETVISGEAIADHNHCGGLEIIQWWKSEI